MNNKLPMTTKIKFDPKTDHFAKLELGWKALASNKQIKTTSVGPYCCAEIDIKYLGVGEYQRYIDLKRAHSISEVFQPQLAFVKVAEIKHKGKYYYQIIDGQHTALAWMLACDVTKIPCFVTNTVPPVDNFMMANDSTRVRPVNTDGEYWAKYVRTKTVLDDRGRNDRDGARFIHNLISEYGFTPKRQKDQVDKDFGNHTSAIHKIYTKYTNQNAIKIPKASIKNLYTIAKEEKVDAQTIKERVFSDVAEIMFDTFGVDSFTYARPHKRAWEGLTIFLGSLDFVYDKDEIKKAFKKADFSKPNGRAVYNAGNSIDQWKMTAHQRFSSPTKVIFEREQWTMLFKAIYKHACS